MCQKCWRRVCLFLLHAEFMSLGRWCWCGTDEKNSPQGRQTDHLDSVLDHDETYTKKYAANVMYRVTLVACALVCGAQQFWVLLGTPETSRRGRSTRKARRALTSNPPGLPPCPCIDGWVLSPSDSPAFSSLVKSSKTTLKSLSENQERKVTLFVTWQAHCVEWNLSIIWYQTINHSPQ